MLSEVDRDRIRRATAHGAPPTLLLHPAPDTDPFGEQLADLARTISDETDGAVTVTEAHNGAGDAAPPDRPALSLARGERAPVCYLALPEGPEQPPFVEALIAWCEGEAAPREPWMVALAELAEPAALTIFIAESCPHCPHAVRAVTRAAIASPLIRATVIDAQRFPELAKPFGVRSVPTTIIDDGLAVGGVFTGRELVAKLLDRGEEGYELDRFRSLLESGRVVAAAEELCTPEGPPRLLAAWRQSATSSRVGLLLAAEQALEAERAALDALVPELCVLLDSDDAALRGDTADLLGRIGLAAARTALEALSDDPNEDVAEIATEALEELTR